MSVNAYFTIKNLTYIYTRNQHIVILLMKLLCGLSLATVSFFVINDENYITNLFDSEINLEMIFAENKSVIWINEEEKITIFKNNILRYEEPFKQPKYYNPNIHTLHHWNSMLFNSKLIKKHLDSKSTNIKIFLKDISYISLLLFLKLIDNSDSFISQINIQDFLDILLIITILDIEKTKERDYFLRDLLRNIMFGVNISDLAFVLEKYYDSYHYRHIRKSIFMGLWINFIGFVTFKDKRAQRFIFLSGKRSFSSRNYKSITDNKIALKKTAKNKLYIRLNDIYTKKISKIIDLSYLMNIWVFLLKITNLDILFLIYFKIETYKNFTRLFSNYMFRTENLYIRSFDLALDFFLKSVNVFSNKLKVFKFEGTLNSLELKKLLGICTNVKNITLKIRILDSEKLRLLIDFCLNNLNVFCKFLCYSYEVLHADIEIIHQIPNNFMFYAMKCQNESPSPHLLAKIIPFFNLYHHSYIHSEFVELSKNFGLFKCFKYKFIEFHFEQNSRPYEFKKKDLKLLRCFDAIKYLFFANVSVDNEFFMYVLESKTIACFQLTNFICEYDSKYFESYATNNQELRNFVVSDSKSYISSTFLVYLTKFECVSCFTLKNIQLKFEALYCSRFYRFFQSRVGNNQNKIYLKYLEIRAATDNTDCVNYLHFLSNIYDFSKILNIIYFVHELREIEFAFFSTMTKLEAITVKVYAKYFQIDWKNLFLSRELFNTILVIDISTHVIRINDINVFKLFNNLKVLSLSCEVLDFDTIHTIKKTDFKNTNLKIKKPSRANRTAEINNYLDSEFNTNFL
ncbi:hypothetical protein CWI36_0073p0010 [Hamiltosporidium magnivora]|uniref:Uncharacterized protein n=1 Tax=Hamiltosporidium magnivora TaxID=148818 RepID=A0A4V2JWR9_9MICR|nr:hypothetical protein CWI36_0073p0010 [Hamiltosporidium magnivora]